MKIGILTFHWATNYGAILQAWCLQEYLIKEGYEVDIIDYKPSQFDFTWKRIVCTPYLWKHLSRTLSNHKKEKLLVPFRQKRLHLTKRYETRKELCEDLGNYDILISGSDQVLNPGFTISGENGKPSSVYWLNFGNLDIRRIGYSVSFGYEEYPDEAAILASKWVNNFDTIGTRELSGQKILFQLGYKGQSVVTPDPTLLLGSDLFERLGIEYNRPVDNYISVYMLRHEIRLEGDIRYIDDMHHPLGMEQWLNTIVHSKGLVTNSYHGMIMAILAHVPFVVLLEAGEDRGMNDRFKTLLKMIGCEDRMTDKLDGILDRLLVPLDFNSIDRRLEDFRKVGVDYLNFKGIIRNV